MHGMLTANCYQRAGALLFPLKVNGTAYGEASSTHLVVERHGCKTARRTCALGAPSRLPLVPICSICSRE